MINTTSSKPLKYNTGNSKKVSKIVYEKETINVPDYYIQSYPGKFAGWFNFTKCLSQKLMFFLEEEMDVHCKINVNKKLIDKFVKLCKEFGEECSVRSVEWTLTEACDNEVLVRESKGIYCFNALYIWRGSQDFRKEEILRQRFLISKYHSAKLNKKKALAVKKKNSQPRLIHDKRSEGTNA